MGAILFAVLVFSAAAAPLLSPHDPFHIDLADRLKPPSFHYPLGTDQLGRCVLSRTFHGTRLSLFSGLAAVALSLFGGLCIGTLSGLAGKRWDAVLMRFTDIALAFPMLILAVAITGILGPSLKSTVIGMALAAWAWWARFVRGIILSAKEKEFVTGGRVIGVHGYRLVRHYILPQVLPPLWVAASLNAGSMIAAVSGLSFIGLGAQPPAPEWGVMLKEARMYLSAAPWMAVAPGLGVTLSVLSLNLIGEGLRDLYQIGTAIRM